MTKSEKQEDYSDYELLIIKPVWDKMKCYVDAVSGEISGMGKAVIDVEAKTITMKDIIIFEQECTGSTTELSEDAMAKFMFELQKKKENIKDWSIWWHSHADMPAFWSVTDENTIQSHDNQAFLISIVTNKKRESLARLDIWQKDPNFEITTCLSQKLKVFTLDAPSPSVKKMVEEEVAKKVKDKTFKPSPPLYYGNKKGDKVLKGSAFGQGQTYWYAGRKFDEFGYDKDGFDEAGYDALGNYDSTKDIYVN